MCLLLRVGDDEEMKEDVAVNASCVDEMVGYDLSPARETAGLYPAPL